MTDRSDLPERLRTLAAHRAKFLGFGTAPEDMEEWQAAEEIDGLKKLVESAFNEGFGEGMDEVQKYRGGKSWPDSRARAKLEGGSND